MGELDLAHVKVADTADLEVFVDNLRQPISIELLARSVEAEHTVGVLRCVLERTISRKSAALGTGAMALSPLVDILQSPHREQDIEYR